MEHKNLTVGAICEISKAYDHTTGSRTLMDEYALCMCEVLEITRSDDVLVWVEGHKKEVFVYRGRLKRIR